MTRILPVEYTFKGPDCCGWWRFSILDPEIPLEAQVGWRGNFYSIENIYFNYFILV